MKKTVAVIVLFAFAAVAAAQEKSGEAKKEKSEKKESKVVKLPDGLQYEDLKVGEGSAPKKGQTCVVHYTGWLTNGKKFDSSVDRGQPFSFQLGAGQVIRGWDEGVSTMHVGGRRKLTIPPNLAYGDRSVGNGLIPPQSTLVFEVELLEVK